LGKKVTTATNRSNQQLGKEAKKKKEIKQVPGRFACPPMDLYQIGNTLEGIKRDTNRQDDVQQRPMRLQAQQGQQFIQVIPEEVVILKDPQGHKIESNPNYQIGRNPTVCLVSARNVLAAHIVDETNCHQQ
jgi:hypothetical protein